MKQLLRSALLTLALLGTLAAIEKSDKSDRGPMIPDPIPCCGGGASVQ